jgi:lipopolysaccharide export system permease protein
MLRIVDRYLLRELAFGVGATALVLLLITAGGTFADVLNKVALGRLPGNVMFPVLGLRVFDALTVLLPVALFLGVLLALSRMYRDAEMHVLAAAGMGPRGLLRPAALLAVPLAMAVGLISLWLGPAAVRTSNAMVATANQSVIAAGLEPGRFVELPGHAGVIFVDAMNSAGTVLTHVFVENERSGGDGTSTLDLVTAAHGVLYRDSDGGQRYLTLTDGHRFEGVLGHDNWRRMRFERNEVALSTPRDEEDDSDPAHAQTSTTLMASADGDAKAELAWRMAAPVTVLVLALLALPLSRQTPREPRYGRLLLAILAYLLYANLLTLTRAGIAAGKLPGWLGLWWVHIVVAALAAWLLWRQYRSRRPVAA